MFLAHAGETEPSCFPRIPLFDILDLPQLDRIDASAQATVYSRDYALLKLLDVLANLLVDYEVLSPSDDAKAQLSWAGWPGSRGLSDMASVPYLRVDK